MTITAERPRRRTLASHVRAHPWRTLGAVLMVPPLAVTGFLAYTGLYRVPTSLPAGRDAAITEVMDGAELPGAAVATLRDGRMASMRGFGQADPATGRRVTPDTLFTVGSVSKTVTATALMTLYEKGALGLDDDVDRHLPFAVRNPAFPDVPITVRMLLQHTSGIRDGDAYGRSYTLTTTPVAPDSPVALGTFLRDYLVPGGRLYSEQSFAGTAPGTHYEYSNVGFGLVGLLVEAVSGRPFPEYCRTAVFEPLGMTRSAWRHADVDLSTMAVPYGYDDLRRRPARIGFYGYPTYPDGALKTSVAEYTRFLSVFVNDGRTPEGAVFLEPGTVAEMLRLTSPPGVTDDGDSAIGLAWHVSGSTYTHDGLDPGVISFVAFDPSNRRAAVLFATGADYDDPVTGTVRQVLADPAAGVRLVAAAVGLEAVVQREVTPSG
ncbi:MAG: beta-lactamase family protein [Actinobacteria bacterium]|nr:beta-lactamase family protein [Actinomycetota bacterium]